MGKLVWHVDGEGTHAKNKREKNRTHRGYRQTERFRLSAHVCCVVFFFLLFFCARSSRHRFRAPPTRPAMKPANYRESLCRPFTFCFSLSTCFVKEKRPMRAAAVLEVGEQKWMGPYLCGVSIRQAVALPRYPSTRVLPFFCASPD